MNSERNEHVVLVAFEVAGDERAEAMDFLVEVFKPYMGFEGRVVGWWIAEDDRPSSTNQDLDSAVFVPKGTQVTYRDMVNDHMDTDMRETYRLIEEAAMKQKFAPYLDNICVTCRAGVGKLCISNGVWVHLPRFMDYYVRDVKKTT